MKINLSNHAFDYGTAVSHPVAKENGRSFLLENNSRIIVKRWAIDKVVFNGRADERCDYLIVLYKEVNKIYYWIELKGCDVVKACKQILNTINQIEVEEKVHEARIISSRTPAPALRDISYKKLDNQMRKSGGCLKIYTNQGTERI